MCQHHYQWGSDRLFSFEQGLALRMPLSPLLFALAIEPLSSNIEYFHWYDPSTQGVQIILYADDLLLYGSGPVKAIPGILSFFHRYGSFSGTKSPLLRENASCLTPYL